MKVKLTSTTGLDFKLLNLGWKAGGELATELWLHFDQLLSG